MNANGPMAPSSRLMTALELSWVLTTLLCQPHECSWLLMNGAHEKTWAIMTRVPISTHKQPREAMSAHDCQWTLKSSREHSGSWCHAAMTTHESSKAVMNIAPRGYGRSSHSRVIMPPLHHTHECSWVHMSARESLWELMTGQKLINKKC